MASSGGGGGGALQCKLPDPPAFLDPLEEINSCYYYSVPKFQPLDHPNTRWMLSMMRNEWLDRLKRKMELQPYLFRSAYFQLTDCPKMYLPEGNVAAQPLFHSRAVLYFNALGLAVYMRSVPVVKLILEHRDPRGEKLYNPAEPQYATHVQDTIGGDFHAFPLWVAVIRSGFFDCAPELLADNAWNLAEPACMPLRRRYERRAICYLDWLDYALALMQERPMMSLARLVYLLTSRLANYKYHRVPISILLKTAETSSSGKSKKINLDDEAPPVSGLMDVNQLPQSARMIGTKSLLELAEEYSCYIQTKERYDTYRGLVTEMIQKRLNPEVEMAKANDYDPGYNADNTEEVFENANNNARSDSSQRQNGANTLVNFVSEPTRILRHALLAESRSNSKLPLGSMLDAVAVYIRRDFYILAPTAAGQMSRTSADDSGRLDELRRRDANNSVVLLLNIIQLQYQRRDELIRQQRKQNTQENKRTSKDSGVQAFNKQRVVTQNIKRLTNQLFQVLLHTGTFVAFMMCDEPPYKLAGPNTTDFATVPALDNYFKALQLDVAAEFNAKKSAWSYLTRSDLEEANRIKILYLNLHFGKPPDKPADGKQTNQHHHRRSQSGVGNTSNLDLAYGGWPVDSSVTSPRRIRFVRVPPRAPPPPPPPPAESASQATTGSCDQEPAQVDIATRLLRSNNSSSSRQQQPEIAKVKAQPKAKAEENGERQQRGGGFVNRRGRWRCRMPCSGVSKRKFQKARVFDSPPDGSEFKMDAGAA